MRIEIDWWDVTEYLFHDNCLSRHFVLNRSTSASRSVSFWIGQSWLGLPTQEIIEKMDLFGVPHWGKTRFIQFSIWWVILAEWLAQKGTFFRILKFFRAELFQTTTKSPQEHLNRLKKIDNKTRKFHVHFYFWCFLQSKQLQWISQKADKNQEHLGKKSTGTVPLELVFKIAWKFTYSNQAWISKIRTRNCISPNRYGTQRGCIHTERSTVFKIDYQICRLCPFMIQWNCVN